MTPSILNNIRQDQITAEPFPHVHVPDALDKDYYEALAAGYPVLQDIAGARPMRRPAPARHGSHGLPAQSVPNLLQSPPEPDPANRNPVPAALS